MATIKFFVKSKKQTAKINVRYLNGKIDLTKVTPLTITTKHFNNKTGKVRQIASEKQKEVINATLSDLHTHILNQSNILSQTQVLPSSEWLKKVINEYFNISKPNDLSLLLNYTAKYIEGLDLHVQTRGVQRIGVAKETKKKYKNIEKKLHLFCQHKNINPYIQDVDLKFRNDFLKFLFEVEKVGQNTAGRYIKFVKTICTHAERAGYKVSRELQQIKGFAVKAKTTYLTIDEINQIAETEIQSEVLNNAKDWLIIGCYIGQRAGDLLKLTPKNISKENDGHSYIELTQQKTGKKVAILVHEKVQDILDKRNGNFPQAYSTNAGSAIAVFNRHIKEVCLMAGLTEKTEGAKINPKTKRKENGTFEKWQLVTSHICRRSFATNFYGKVPTAIIMQLTGHATETQLLAYIGKTPLDYAKQLKEIWATQNKFKNIQQGKQSPFTNIVQKGGANA